MNEELAITVIRKIPAGHGSASIFGCNPYLTFDALSTRTEIITGTARLKLDFFDNQFLFIYPFLREFLGLLSGHLRGGIEETFRSWQWLNHNVFKKHDTFWVMPLQSKCAA